MKPTIPLQLSRSLLDVTGTIVTLHYLERIPTKNKFLVVSNHRSLLDAPLLMTAISRPVRFVCHHYMSQVPLLQQAVALMGAFPLEADQRRQSSFFWQSARFLQANQVVGVFPEGADPMVKVNAPPAAQPVSQGFCASCPEGACGRPGDPAGCDCFKGGKAGKACSACLVSALRSIGSIVSTRWLAFCNPLPAC